MWIANFGSNAKSLVAAENAALMYHWWFLVLFALVGSSIAQMALQVRLLSTKVQILSTVHYYCS